MKEESHIFTREELDNIEVLGDVLRKIHNRLLAEGKVRVENGKVVFLKDNFKNNDTD
jgi:hypothetical protein